MTEIPAIQVVACDGSIVMISLHQLAQAHARIRRTPSDGAIRAIQDACAEHFGISAKDIRSARRSAHLVRARHVAMYLAREFTEYSLPQIGRCFGGRDHTTVMHSIRKIAHLLDGDAGMRADITLLRSAIAAGEVAA